MKNIYFSDLLPGRFPQFFEDLTGVLDSNKVPWVLLPHTKDIWCRDYMPVPVGRGRFLQFRYLPSYLKAKKWRPTITDAAKTCEAIGIIPKVWEIVVDGGNVIRLGSTAIMTERVYRENSDYPEEVLADLLKELLRVKDLIMIPEEPGDPYGHADGCIRFIDNDTVLINEPHQSHPSFILALRKTLKAHRLGYVEMPCFIDYDPKYKDSAVGNYVNYLQVKDLIIAPAYADYPEQNKRALEVLKRVFNQKKIVQIESTCVAKEGGVLNCISWVNA